MTNDSKSKNPIERYGGAIDIAHIPRAFAVYRHLLGLLPKDPRCKACHAPFKGVGALIVRVLLGKRPSNYSALLCNKCEKSIREHPGGAEVELTILFADVRGSTALAEKMSPSAFRDLIDRFYTTATKIFVRSDAFIDKLSGDEVLAVYLPALAGPDHAARAIEAARELMKATGHADIGGPWIRVGAGIHTGIAWLGSLGTPDGVTDLTVLGDAVNTASRLASEAGAGEIVVSEQSMRAGQIETGNYARRGLRLKGKTEEVLVCVLKTGKAGLDAGSSG
jgi:adenylate cyclase